MGNDNPCKTTGIGSIKLRSTLEKVRCMLSNAGLETFGRIRDWANIPHIPQNSCGSIMIAQLDQRTILK